MTVEIRRTLKLFSWARAQHRLRSLGKPAGFADASELIAAETGICVTKVSAVLAGVNSSADTQEKIAAWNGLVRATRHGEPVLIVDFRGGAQ